MDYITKEKFLSNTLRDILDISTRHNRGTDEQKYLISDLERIEQLVERGKDILNSDKEEYSEYSVSKINNKEIMDGIDKISKK